jgi:hypothetical protein
MCEKGVKMRAAKSELRVDERARGKKRRENDLESHLIQDPL